VAVRNQCVFPTLSMGLEKKDRCHVSQQVYSLQTWKGPMAKPIWSEPGGRIAQISSDERRPGGAATGDEVTVH